MIEVFDPHEYHIMSGDSIDGREFAPMQPGVVIPGLTFVDLAPESKATAYVYNHASCESGCPTSRQNWGDSDRLNGV